MQIGIMLDLLDTAHTSSRVGYYLKRGGISIYHTLSLFVGTGAPEPVAVHGRVLTWSAGFAFMVISAAYTYPLQCGLAMLLSNASVLACHAYVRANLATILQVRARPSLAVNSIDDLIARNLPASVTLQAAARLQAQYPGLKMVKDTVMSNEALLTSVQTGAAVATVINSPDWQGAKADGTACGFTAIGEYTCAIVCYGDRSFVQGSLSHSARQDGSQAQEQIHSASSQPCRLASSLWRLAAT